MVFPGWRVVRAAEGKQQVLPDRTDRGVAGGLTEGSRIMDLNKQWQRAAADPSLAEHICMLRKKSTSVAPVLAGCRRR